MPHPVNPYDDDRVMVDELPELLDHLRVLIGEGRATVADGPGRAVIVECEGARLTISFDKGRFPCVMYTNLACIGKDEIELVAGMFMREINAFTDAVSPASQRYRANRAGVLKWISRVCEVANYPKQR